VYGYNRLVPVARAACVVSLIALVLLALAGPLYRVGVLGLPAAFQLLRWAAYLGAGGMAAALTAAVVSYWRGTRAMRVLAALAFAGGLVALAIPYQLQRSARGLPPIHDITTDLDNPPAFDAVAPLRATAPNSLERSPELARQQREGYPDIAPITVSAPPDQVFDRALAAAQEEGWQIVTADKSTGRIEATATTRWFGFKDDVVVRLTPWGTGTRVDMRSVSRVGRGDVGMNARRIRDYLEKLN
jgi:uncharacterized protein (DUF1499 family)